MKAVIALGSIPNKVQVGDMGVDDGEGNLGRTDCEETGVMINEIEFSTYHEVIADELRAALGRYFEKWDEI
jgi:hypothetical protein